MNSNQMNLVSPVAGDMSLVNPIDYDASGVHGRKMSSIESPYTKRIAQSTRNRNAAEQAHHFMMNRSSESN
jgi:hypothetical protein